MRLWSIHPCYLDAKGLVALWREGLLAQKVLLGKTKGYKHHPQLIRFKNSGNPVGAIAGYLRGVADEGEKRGYRFDRGKIAPKNYRGKLRITTGQKRHEFRHLLEKLKRRDKASYHRLRKIRKIRAGPIFVAVRGGVEPWEIR